MQNSEVKLAPCVYCGDDTRHHDKVPPKIFLDEEFYSGVASVPACYKCCQGYHLDEEYLACLVECAKCGTVDANAIERSIIKFIINEKPLLFEKLSKAKSPTGGFNFKSDSVRHAVVKLARLHAAHQMNEPLTKSPTSVIITPLDSMPFGERDKFETPPSPIIGSRAMRIMSAEVNGGYFTEWVDIQPGQYRHLTFVSEKIFSRIVLGEYLACEVAWE